MDARRDFFLRHARGPLGGLALVLLCCTVYLPGFFSIPPVDRDESRFAQASRQMFESVALPQADRDPVLHSGGLAVPMVGGKERLNKPPLIYWLQAVSAAVCTQGNPLRDAIWMYRIPSLLAGLVTILATWRIGVSMFDPRVGWLAAALLAVAPVFVWEAHQARADMVMVACTTLAMSQLFTIWRRASCVVRSGAVSRSRRDRAGGRAPTSCLPTSPPLSTPFLRLSISSSLCLWIPTTLGILTKGPITPMVVALTALWLSVFSRDLRWLRATRPVLGLAIILGGVSPWVYAVAQHVGFTHYGSIVYDEVLGRAGGAKEGHWGPPGYHIVLLAVLFWPGSLLTGLAISRAWNRAHQSRVREHAEGAPSAPRPQPTPARTTSTPTDPTPGSDSPRDTPTVPATPHALSASLRSRLGRIGHSLATLRVTRRPEAFLIAWFLPSWIVFELVGTKLPHYTMPLYPAVALMTARAAFAADCAALPGVERPVNRVGFAVWCVPGALIALGLGAAAYSSLSGDWNERPPAWLLWGLLFISFGATVTAIGAIRHRLWLGAYACGIVMSVCMSVGLLGGYLPHVDRVWFTKTLVKEATAANGGAIAASGFSEDSLVFLTRGRIQFVEPNDEGAWWADHPTGVMIMPYGQVGRMHSVVGEVHGLRYTKGRLEHLAVVKRWGPDGPEPRQ